jgi:magnesium transporter
MRLETLFGSDLEQRLASDPENLRQQLAEFHPGDIAEALNHCSRDQIVAILKVLPHDLAAKVLDALETTEQKADILERIEPETAALIVRRMAADERADVMQTLPPAFATELLGELQQTTPEIAKEVQELALWDEHSAGGLMTTQYVGLPPDMKAWQAIEELRRFGKEKQAETIYYIYVVAYGNKLLGVVSLRDLLLAEPSSALSDVMAENVVQVSPTADQEEVARYIAKYDLSAVPVVDEHGHMLGVVTVDDVVDVVIEEATEDAQRMAAVEPIDEAYFKTGFFTFIQKRVTWLVVLFAGELLTTNVMKSYEAEIARVVDLVLFVPLIISSGGNSGSQSSSLIIRALAVGEVRVADWKRVVLRELGIGLMLGMILGVVGFMRAVYALGWGGVSIAVSLSIVCVVTLGTLLGSVLPLLIRKVGLDPAVSSTPFIASLVDVLGLIAYFSLSRWILAATM